MGAQSLQQLLSKGAPRSAVPLAHPCALVVAAAAAAAMVVLDGGGVGFGDGA